MFTAGELWMFNKLDTHSTMDMEWPKGYLSVDHKEQILPIIHVIGLSGWFGVLSEDRPYNFQSPQDDSPKPLQPRNPVSFARPILCYADDAYRILERVLQFPHRGIL